MHWQIEISGDPDRLRQANIDLYGSEISIAQEGENFFLESKLFLSELSWDEISKIAIRIINTLNGAMNQAGKGGGIITQYGFPIKVMDDGVKEVAIRIVGKPILGIPAALIRVYDGEGNIAKPTPTTNFVPSLVGLGLVDDEVADILRWWGKEKLDWFTLYKIYEIILKSAANDQVSKLAKLGWASPAEIKLFKGTVNSKDAIGDEARHAVQKNASPRNPMKFHVAESLIRRLIRHWLNHKIQYQKSK